MNDLTKEYTIKGFDYSLRIRPNYDTYINECDDVIFIDRNDDWSEEQITITINEARKLINVLTEIIDVVENQPAHIVGDSVTVLSGKFFGFKGRIVDIDEVATKNQVAVMVDKSDENDEFMIFVNKDNIE